MSSSGKGQSLVQGSRRAGTRLALRLRRVARRHPRTDHRGVHPLRQRDHAADRHPEGRPDAFLPADRPCRRRAATTARASSPPAIAPEHLAEAQAHGRRRHARPSTGAGLWGVEFFLSRDNGRLLLGAVAAAARHGHGDACRYAESQRIRTAPAAPYSACRSRAVTLRAHGRQRRHPLARSQDRRTAALPGAKRRSAARRSPHRPAHFRQALDASVNRRMGVVVRYEPHGSSLEALRERVCAAAAKVKVTE